MSVAASNSDRYTELKTFDESKLGVKGLVDSGLTQLPRIFHHPPETLPDINRPQPQVTVPVIDLSGSRDEVVAHVRQAASEFGFFQVVNHPVPVPLLDRLLDAVRCFNEAPASEKTPYYTRAMGTGVSFSSNVDLFVSKAASWRDTLTVKLGPNMPDLDLIPEICREVTAEWNKEVLNLGEILMGMLSEGLGLSVDRLKEMSCLEARVMVAHYYPHCPQPDLTLGLTSHSDPGVLTVLLQDHVGGLQVKYQEDWIDVKPIHGALVINVGDILQIMSNDEFKSVDHRVLATAFKEPRIAVAVFFNPSARESIYGPIPELVSEQKPAIYRQFTFNEFMTRFFSKGLDGKSLIEYYKLQNVENEDDQISK
ncbi:hypothetical protein V2J09_001684 [Rumex salicifolius]